MEGGSWCCGGGMVVQHYPVSLLASLARRGGSRPGLTLRRDI